MKKIQKNSRRLTDTDFDTVSDELISEIRLSAFHGDVDGSLNLIKKLGPENKDLFCILYDYIGDFRFEEIINVIDSRGKRN